MSDSEDKAEFVNAYDRIKTHFPSARIKKIMQSDEDVGKVAQATPIVIGRALELFLCSLLEKSSAIAKEKGSRRITAQHITAAVNENEQFDFCVQACEKHTSS